MDHRNVTFLVLMFLLYLYNVLTLGLAGRRVWLFLCMDLYNLLHIYNCFKMEKFQKKNWVPFQVYCQATQVC